MDSKAILNLNIRTYRNLKDQYELIGQRLDELNKRIKEDTLAIVQDVEGRGYVPPHINYYGASGFKVRVTLKQAKPKPDPYALEDLLRKKRLWDTCMKEVIDEDMVEICFINGILTDADMRSIIAEPSKPQLALTVERVDESV